jgi:hypothetical protein
MNDSRIHIGTTLLGMRGQQGERLVDERRVLVQQPGIFAFGVAAGCAQGARDTMHHGGDPVDLGQVGVGNQSDSHADRIGVGRQVVVTSGLQVGNGGVGGKHEPDGRATAEHTVGRGVSPMGFHQMLHDREPQPRATLLA